MVRGAPLLVCRDRAGQFPLAVDTGDWAGEVVGDQAESEPGVVGLVGPQGDVLATGAGSVEAVEWP